MQLALFASTLYLGGLLAFSLLPKESRDPAFNMSDEEDLCCKVSFFHLLSDDTSVAARIFVSHTKDTYSFLIRIYCRCLYPSTEKLHDAWVV